MRRRCRWRRGWPVPWCVTEAWPHQQTGAHAQSKCQISWRGVRRCPTLKRRLLRKSRGRDHHGASPSAALSTAAATATGPTVTTAARARAGAAAPDGAASTLVALIAEVRRRRDHVR